MGGTVAALGTVVSRWRPRPRLLLFGRRRSSYRVCGVAGLGVATALATVLAAHSGLSHAANGALLVTAIGVFLALALATKAIVGQEALIYYHHEVAILAASAAVLAAFGWPVRAHLDVMALALGTFLAFGRVGCLMVGCCYGTPHHWGVEYGEEHAAGAFPRHLVGVRLLPVQLFEALVVVLLVVMGSVLFLQASPAGTALSWYVVGYAAARFWLERVRADYGRPYWRGFSEAQWTSLVLMSGTVAAEWQGRLPFSPWHTALWASVGLGMPALTLRMYRIRRRVAAAAAAQSVASVTR